MLIWHSLRDIFANVLFTACTILKWHGHGIIIKNIKLYWKKLIFSFYSNFLIDEELLLFFKNKIKNCTHIFVLPPLDPTKHMLNVKILPFFYNKNIVLLIKFIENWESYKLLKSVKDSFPIKAFIEDWESYRPIKLIEDSFMFRYNYPNTTILSSLKLWNNYLAPVFRDIH